MVKRVLWEFPVLLTISDGIIESMLGGTYDGDELTPSSRIDLEKYRLIRGVYQFPVTELDFLIPGRKVSEPPNLFRLKKLSQRVADRKIKGDYQCIRCELVYPRKLKVFNTVFEHLDSFVRNEHFLIKTKNKNDQQIFGEIRISRDSRKVLGRNLNYEFNIPRKVGYLLGGIGLKIDDFNIYPYQKHLPQRLEGLFPEYDF
ncbi:MAG: hypothetical protein U9Q06_04820 [Nanoarchaeota archaeon]|nr:hypothetical protein [Nanoarchaeota archaeon]